MGKELNLFDLLDRLSEESQETMENMFKDSDGNQCLPNENGNWDEDTVEDHLNKYRD